MALGRQAEPVAVFSALASVVLRALEALLARVPPPEPAALAHLQAALQPAQLHLLRHPPLDLHPAAHLQVEHLAPKRLSQPRADLHHLSLVPVQLVRALPSPALSPLPARALPSLAQHRRVDPRRLRALLNPAHHRRADPQHLSLVPAQSVKVLLSPAQSAQPARVLRSLAKQHRAA